MYIGPWQEYQLSLSVQQRKRAETHRDADSKRVDSENASATEASPNNSKVVPQLRQCEKPHKHRQSRRKHGYGNWIHNSSSPRSELIPTARSKSVRKTVALCKSKEGLCSESSDYPVQLISQLKENYPDLFRLPSCEVESCSCETGNENTDTSNVTNTNTFAITEVTESEVKDLLDWTSTL